MKTGMIIKTAVTLTLVSLLASCSPSSSNNAAQTLQSSDQQTLNENIVGGVNATTDYQKSNGIVGLLMIYENQSGQQLSSLCTASLISSNVAVTAAHCLVAPKDTQLLAALVFFGSDLSVVMDEVSQKDLSLVRPITKVKRHEHYLQSRSTNNDIGLVRFEGTAPEGFQVAHLASAQMARTIRKGSTVTLAGFGVSDYKLDPNTEKPVGSGDGLLREVGGIRLLSMTATGQEMTFDQSHGRGACHGDSGGPAYLMDSVTHKNILIGVTSRGTSQQGLCDGQVIYTGVMGYAQWLQDGLKEMAAQ